MSNSVFPAFPGLMWDFTLGERFDTVIYPAAAPGFETRISKGPDPTFAIKLQYEFLRNKPAPGPDELSTIRAFFRAMRGDFDSFLLDLTTLTHNTADDSIAGQLLTVDGNKYAPLIRTVVGSPSNDETIYEVKAFTVVKANGVAVFQSGHNVAPTSGNY